MSSSLKQRLTAEPVRFVYQRDMPNEMVELLRGKLGISNYDSVIAGGRYHNFKDFISFPNVGKANPVTSRCRACATSGSTVSATASTPFAKRRAALLPVPHLRARAGAAAPGVVRSERVGYQDQHLSGGERFAHHRIDDPRRAQRQEGHGGGRAAGALRRRGQHSLGEAPDRSRRARDLLRAGPENPRQAVPDFAP